ncbi:MAG: taurine dioxygenase [Gammaproteobacteria bacterium]
MIIAFVGCSKILSEITSVFLWLFFLSSDNVNKLRESFMFIVKPVAGSLGAEISGIDLAGVITDPMYTEINRLLVEYGVIFFRDQNISHMRQKELAMSFGPLQSHPAYDTIEGFPEITILESTPEKPSKIEKWHTDMTFREHPPMGTVLLSKIIPEKGGDTLWSCMSTAYLGLSNAMQDMLEGLTAIHDFRHGFRESLAEAGGQRRLAQAIADNPPVEHPVIRTHPESGKKVIYVNSLFTTHIVGLPSKESEVLLQFLFDHVTTPEYTCRFSWQANSIAIWDNRSTQHKPVNDYFPAYRRLERITIDGDTPY